MDKQIVSVRIPKELLKKIDSAAAKEYRTRTTWIIQAIVNQLAKVDATKPEKN